jgi:two-component system, NtrC family, sensor kinase
MAKGKRRAHRSLRTILMVWFLLFSIVPLAFVTGYSVIKYERAIDNELSRRLSGNAREVAAIFEDFKTGLIQKRSRYLKDNSLLYNLSTSDAAAVRALGLNWLKSDFASSLTFFNRDGRMLVSVFKDGEGVVRDFYPRGNGAVFLSDENLAKLKDVKEYSFIEFTNNQKLSLILFTKVYGSGNRHLGYLEQLIELDQTYLDRLKQRMRLELMMVRTSGQVAVGTNPDFYLYKKEFFQGLLRDGKRSFFELNLRSSPYGFILYPLRWGQSDMFLALGASKVEAKAVLRNVNYAFYTVVGAVILLLIITILITSNTILKPLNDLVSAIDSVQSGDRPVEIPIKSDTEIGLLTESFNQMSRKITQARDELKKKIKELEGANQELMETQSQLVHSSKMVSLGQLVAGVAHELNNPIGFIYSNMTHLRTYTDKLIALADTAQKHPEKIEEKINEVDLEYIREDLPKLISSCEDGARRTRDIVLGLRNFSRLEEAKLKEIDIGESIDNTLNLLSGEIKNRIQVMKDYGSLPPVNCFASQINQVFMNILSNAIQAIEGKGNIWITAKKVKATGGDDFVHISFQDSGKGMTTQVMEKIFDPFFSTKGVGQGTGLGLSISYGILQTHGGDIQVKSQIGIGTEFIVKIPVVAKVSETSPKSPA